MRQVYLRDKAEDRLILKIQFQVQIPPFSEVQRFLSSGSLGSGTI